MDKENKICLALRRDEFKSFTAKAYVPSTQKCLSKKSLFLS